MLRLIEVIVLVSFLVYVAKIHIQINKPNKRKDIPVATSLIREKVNSHLAYEKREQEKSVISTPQSEFESCSESQQVDVNDIVAKKIIKESLEDFKDTVETSQNIVPERKIFEVSEERLLSIERDREESTIMQNVVDIEKSLTEQEDVSTEQTSIDYNNVLSQDYRNQVCQSIVENEEHKWYEKVISGGSIVKIETGDFTVEEYTY